MEPPFLGGDTSSNGGCPIAMLSMLVYRSVAHYVDGQNIAPLAKKNN